METTASRDEVRISTDESGRVTRSVRGASGSLTITHPDGTVVRSHEGADPRFGVQASLPQSSSVQAPSGLVVQPHRRAGAAG